MKILNKSATRTFRYLIAGLAPGQAKKIENGKGFMAVSVDCLSSDRGGIVKMYAVAHRYEQNGDLVPDPDVEFMVVTDGAEYFAVSPVAIDQQGAYVRSATVEAGEVKEYYPARQADLTSFCNMWMKNIRDQQGLGKVVV